MMSERFPLLEAKISGLVCDTTEDIIFYGEVYGGKCQKMSHVYGPLNFIVFEVKVNDTWLTVPLAKVLADLAALPFVHFEEGPAEISWLNAQRDKPSVQAERNGLGEQYGEGIVIRPLKEMTDHWGNRLMAKHKAEKYLEVRTPREIDPEKQARWEGATKVANEFMVPMRLEHVLDRLKAGGINADELGLTALKHVIPACISDIKVEEGDTIEWSKDVEKAIGRVAVKLFKERLKLTLENKA